MDRSYPTTRRVIRRTRLQRRVAIAVAAGVASCAILFGAIEPAPVDAPVHAGAAAAAPAVKRAIDAAPQPPRRVYPYSIVPGGVTGAAELARVIRKDRVVAAHYATFDVAHAEKKTVTTPRAVHVSYRKGDKVYWTAKKLMLSVGETLLSDGSHEVRARCANRISDTPQFPVEAHEPSAAELDSSVIEDRPAQGGLENVSMGMLEDGDGRPGGFLNAPGTAGAASVGGSAGRTASSSLSFTGGQPMLAPVSRGGLLGAGTSSSTGTRPAPGTPSPDGVTDSPAQSTPDKNTGGFAPGSPDMTNIPAATSPLPSTPPSPIQPDATLPSTPANPVTTPPADLPIAEPGLGLPGALPTPVPGVDAAPLPGDLSGGGDNSVDAPVTSPPGAGIDGPDNSPIPAPTLTAPILPAQPVKDAATPTQIPEPGTLWLAAAALAGLLVRRRAPCRAR